MHERKNYLWQLWNFFGSKNISHVFLVFFYFLIFLQFSGLVDAWGRFQKGKYFVITCQQVAQLICKSDVEDNCS